MNLALTSYKSGWFTFGGERRRTDSTMFGYRPQIYRNRHLVSTLCCWDIQRIVAQLKKKHRHSDYWSQRSETLAITDKTYLMFEGGILKAGSQLVEDEMVRRVYLGQNFDWKTGI
jgi:lipopolysaccharide export system ATP-binding protein